MPHLLDKDNRIPGPYPSLHLIRGKADIHEEVFEGQDPIEIVACGNVDRLDSRIEDTRKVAIACPHQHVAADEVANVEAAQIVNVQEASVVNVSDEETDRIHMSRDHDALPRLVGRCGGSPDRDQVAERVGVNVIHQPCDRFADRRPHTLFSAGNTANCGETTKQGQIHDTVPG
jgi:hypothetical protein